MKDGIAPRLEYESAELAGHNWVQVVHPHDWDELERMAADCKRGVGGIYLTRNIGRQGHTLYLSTRTFVRQACDGKRLIRGVTTLEAWDTPRTIHILKTAIKCWWLAYMVPLGECAWNLVHLVQ